MCIELPAEKSKKVRLYSDLSIVSKMVMKDLKQRIGIDSTSNLLRIAQKDLLYMHIGNQCSAPMYSHPEGYFRSSTAPNVSTQQF